ncbi:Uncharacterised protein [Bordetella pertussis]|nr:Uncharacterised protein [Bordetella pertussis]CFO72473.1 Uncharacterised protein [Bordetella pertussis]CPL41142.1 Uncharacterised protein [Bordetella pertussis]CPL85924.1 Uncharacterised protein [Bordetella pertussis]CPN55718.1 Uncharacterised protein [Bordetella pertussis]
MAGTILGLTNEATWIFFRPVAVSASTRATLLASGYSVFSLWKPSRGPSSWNSTNLGYAISPSNLTVIQLKNRRNSMQIAMEHIFFF